MKIREIATPAILLDMDVLERNVEKYQELCDLFGKELWPMVESHRSMSVAAMQAEAGAAGFLCATLGQCEALCEAGYENLMYAFPVMDADVERVIALSKKCNFIIRLDSVEAAEPVDNAAREAGIIVNYTIAVDCGLHRFGAAPDKVEELAAQLDEFENLEPLGISTYPGAVYLAEEPRRAPFYARAESAAVAMAAEGMRRAGLEPELFTGGATPTFPLSIDDPNMSVYHPGDYVFNDAAQMFAGGLGEKDCALTVLATVVSRLSEDTYLCDAGSGCLGEVRGLFGSENLPGYGRVLGHPELTVSSLTGESCSITVQEGECTELQVGDRIRIIPNHAAAVAALADGFVAVRGEETEGAVAADLPGRC